MKKFKIISTFALALWLVVFIQIAMTRQFVLQTDFMEAFTRNQVSYDEEQNCTNIIMGTPLVNSDI